MLAAHELPTQSVAPTPDLISPRLASLIARLQEAPRQDIAALANVLEADLTFDDISPFVRFGADTYQRNLLFSGDGVELRLLCWQPGQSSSLHGHGDAACAFRVMRGVATEIILGDGDRVWEAGSIILEKAKRVHQLVDASQEPLCTLHAYSPPLSFNRPTERLHHVVIVGGGCSSALLASQLLEAGGPTLRVSIVETRSGLCRRACGELDAATVARLYDAVRATRSKIRIARNDVVGLTPTHVTLCDKRELPADAIVFATDVAPDLLESFGLQPDYDCRVREASGGGAPSPRFFALGAAGDAETIRRSLLAA